MHVASPSPPSKRIATVKTVSPKYSSFSIRPSLSILFHTLSISSIPENGSQSNPISFSRFAADVLKGTQTISAVKAADLDKDLMSESGGFSIDQLMELAGLSVAEAGALETSWLR